MIKLNSIVDSFPQHLLWVIVLPKETDAIFNKFVHRKMNENKLDPKKEYQVLHWNNIKDQMPIKDGNYIVYTTYGLDNIVIMPFERGSFHDYDHEDYDIDPSDYITHWMYLPLIPKG